MESSSPQQEQNQQLLFPGLLHTIIYVQLHESLSTLCREYETDVDRFQKELNVRIEEKKEVINDIEKVLWPIGTNKHNYHDWNSQLERADVVDKRMLYLFYKAQMAIQVCEELLESSKRRFMRKFWENFDVSNYQRHHTRNPSKIIRLPDFDIIENFSSDFFYLKAFIRSIPCYKKWDFILQEACSIEKCNYSIIS